jgi:hypothetical protein
VTRRDVATILWLAGLLILLVGVVIRLTEHRPVGGDVLLAGAAIVILSRLGSFRKR